MRSLATLGLALVAMLAMSACGDNIVPGGQIDAPNGADARVDGTPIDGTVDGNVDAPDGGGGGTFTAFVIDQITNRTVDNADAVPFTDFATLPDPDLAATDNTPYASLFL